MTERELAKAVLDEFASVAAAMVGSNPRIEPEDEGLSGVWGLTLNVAGTLEGTVTLGVAHDDASRLAAFVMGFDNAPDDDVVSDSLREMAQQVASALSVAHGPGVTLTAGGSVQTIPAAPVSSSWSAVVLGELRTHVAIWHDLASVRQSAAPSVAPTTDPRLAPSSARPAAPAAPAPTNLELILDIELPLWVRFGETALTLQALTKVGPGTTLDLERSPEDPVDVMVNNTVIARGEVVVVAGNYGVRVTEVVSATDRIRSLAG